jgi:Holliday junction resolvase
MGTELVLLIWAVHSLHIASLPRGKFEMTRHKKELIPGRPAHANTNQTRPRIKELVKPDEIIPGEKKRRTINSRNKGATGEREFAQYLSEAGLKARRGQQFHGGSDSPDVVCEELTGIHFEVKRVQRGQLYDWMKQATRDARSKTPVVAHRRNGMPWVAIVPMDFMVELLKLREGNFL